MPIYHWWANPRKWQQTSVLQRHASAERGALAGAPLRHKSLQSNEECDETWVWDDGTRNLNIWVIGH